MNGQASPLRHLYDDQSTRSYSHATISQPDMNNALREASVMQDTLRSMSVGVVDETEQHSKTSQRSDDSFSAYIEHSIRQSTPPRVVKTETSSQMERTGDRLREGTDGGFSMHSGSSEEVDEIEEDEADASWPSMIDHEPEHYQHHRVVSHGSIVIPEMQDQDEEDCDIDIGGEKKRRRRTNKAEANVLASVFAQTQFPDAHTREALAQRLNMKPKAVSIWFQNRRQAMKKRASRFGGVEGVNGPTVTTASVQVFDVGRTKRLQSESRDLSSERLKRWMSLDDIAAVASKEIASPSLEKVQLPKIEDTSSIPHQERADNKLSSTPILDFICKQRGHQQLSRMVSMPSLASLMSAKEEKSKSQSLKKDLRNLLPGRDHSSGRPELYRSTSASSLLLPRQDEDEQPQENRVHRERCISLQMNNDGRAAVGNLHLRQHPDESKCTLVEGKVTFPAILTKILQRRGRLESNQTQNIWKRMQSSSSSSDGQVESQDSNKENFDPRERSKRQEEGEEDEERTLRMIAGKRAARDQAKKEQKLSEEGRRYVQEADARIALQQRKRSSLSSNTLSRKLDKVMMPLAGNTRKLNRAVSDAQILQRNRVSLTRVPSLEMTAGRDRSKDDESTPFRGLFEIRVAKRPYQISMDQDENAVPVSLQARALQQQRKRSRHSTSIGLQSQARVLSQGGNTSMPVGARRPDHSLLRRFAPSQSLPTPALSLLSSRLGGASFPFTSSSANRFESARESSARLDGAQAMPASQESSENGSDDWVEAWAYDKTAGGQSRDSNVLRDGSAILNKVVKSQQPVARHDDSGFYGSDSEGEHGQDSLTDILRSKLVNRSSSSPSKRGDERDRLAAETLLGLGSRS